MVARAFIDDIRSLGFAGISAAYATVGAVVSVKARILIFDNNTEGDLFFTYDNTVDKLFVKKGSFKLIDIQANINPQFDDKYVMSEGTQWYVKQITAPVSGAVYIQIFY